MPMDSKPRPVSFTTTEFRRLKALRDLVQPELLHRRRLAFLKWLIANDRLEPHP